MDSSVNYLMGKEINEKKVIFRVIHEGNYHPIKYFRLITQICRQQLIGLRSLEEFKDNKMSEFLVQISSAAN